MAEIQAGNGRPDVRRRVGRVQLCRDGWQQPRRQHWDVPDMEAFQAAQTAASPEMAAAMERYGMISPVTIYIKK